MLYGFLGKQFGKVHRYNVRNPSEAIRAMNATLNGFRKAVLEGGSYKVLIGGSKSIGIDELPNPMSDKETIRIIPVVEGSGGAAKIILGAAIIFATAGAASPLIFGAAGIGGTGFLATMTVASLGASIGTSLIMGGIAELLFAPPDAPEVATREEVNNRPSFTFDGSINTVAQGNPVPICYGRLIVGSQVISAGMSVEQGA